VYVHYLPSLRLLDVSALLRGGKFVFDFSIAAGYPHEAPKVLCLTKVRLSPLNHQIVRHRSWPKCACKYGWLVCSCGLESATVVSGVLGIADLPLPQAAMCGLLLSICLTFCAIPGVPPQHRPRRQDLPQHLARGLEASAQYL
jgi:hypothetical protein